MKKIIFFSLVSSGFLFLNQKVNADWDHWGFSHTQTNKASQNDFSYGDNSGWIINKVNSETGVKTFETSFCDPIYTLANFGSYNCHNDTDKISIENDGKILIKKTDINGNSNEEYHYYDPSSKTWSSSTEKWDSSYEKVIRKNLIYQKSNGEIHIGENSWITKEENGRQKVYAKDAAGNPIPIDYTNGTKLLINGRDVEQSINNVGALSAALTGLPTVPTDTTFACGLGTGTHGGDLAFSGGCASRVNEKLSINYAASMTMPGQDYAGDFEDTFSARAGFVWKLGKATQPNLISMKKNQKLINEITDLKSENKKLNKKITKFETEKSELLARLERLEKIALSETNSRDLATIKLP